MTTSSISLVANSWLDDQSNKIRTKPVPWEGYQRAGLISPEELALVKRVERQPKARVESVLATDGQAFASLYLLLLKKVQRVDTMHLILVLIADALQDHEDRISLFVKAGETDPDMPYGPLLKALETQDEFVQLKASQILTVLLSAEHKPLPAHILEPFVTLLSTLVQGTTNPRDVAVQCLEALLPRPEVRSAVWSKPAIVQGFIDILKTQPSPQMCYQVGFCFWLLSFDDAVATEINAKFDIVAILTGIAQAAVKEKVIRVVIATFRNLVVKAPSANLPPMLVAKVLPFVKNLATRKWSDEDIIEDITFLRDELTANFNSLTTYDEYTSELQSGHLSWSPVHDSQTFWKENATKLNDENYKQLKLLIGLLQSSDDPIVLAVAAHDIGQYVKFYDRGKKAVTDLGGKTRVMELMTHTNTDVRYQALISVQRLVAHPWKA
ncbi:ATPase, V1 complex, subunit H [Exidia glandulosa HHB12029]|uniref:V-type proton ATPase subunit H n=1 Tax=Exidia glandulosa HHB12029 TaxID=1314781 RepID=A0A165IY38_EXIGL|nr:ATPase, V1 complex, subunit H [Exidia glandulosa HHB12029]